MHTFFKDNADYAQDKANTNYATDFLPIDYYWLKEQFAKHELKTLIIDNRCKERTASMGVDKFANVQALIVTNPSGEDLTNLALLIRQGHSHIHHLHYINVQTDIHAILINAFLWQRLATLFLKNVSDYFMRKVLERINETQTLINQIIAQADTPEIKERARTKDYFSIEKFLVCDCDLSQSTFDQVCALENIGVVSDDEKSDDDKPAFRQ